MEDANLAVVLSAASPLCLMSRVSTPCWVGRPALLWDTTRCGDAAPLSHYSLRATLHRCTLR